MNNITLVSGHVLIPHQADWANPPTLENQWRTGISSGMTGLEVRQSNRQEAWIKLSYEVLTYNEVEQARCEMRIRQGLRTGRVAVPYWGRSAKLGSPALTPHRQIDLDTIQHRFQSTDHILIQSTVPAEFDSWAVARIGSVSGARLYLDSAIGLDMPAGSRVWRLLFGRPIEPDFEVVNASRSRIRIQVLCDRRQINAFAHDDFGDYPVGIVTATLDGGAGWDGEWRSGRIAA